MTDDPAAARRRPGPGARRAGRAARPEPDLEVVAEVGRGDEVVPAAREHAPDVALLDVEMPGLDGIEATAALKGAARRSGS